MLGVAGTRPDEVNGFFHAVIWLKHCAQAVRSRDRIPEKSLNFFSISLILPAALALGFTQPLTENSTRNIPGGKAWLAHKADNLTSISEPTV
jgi:hypothetical protein